MSETVTPPAPPGDGAETPDGHRTPVPMPVAHFEDPHLQDAARHPRRVENFVAVFFLLGILGVCALRCRLLGQRQADRHRRHLRGRAVLPRVRADGLGQVPDAPGPLRRGAPRAALDRRGAGRHVGRPGATDRRGGQAAQVPGRPAGDRFRDLRHRGPLPAPALARARPRQQPGRHQLAAQQPAGRRQRPPDPRRRPAARRHRDRLPRTASRTPTRGRPTTRRS